MMISVLFCPNTVYSSHYESLSQQHYFWVTFSITQLQSHYLNKVITFMFNKYKQLNHCESFSRLSFVRYLESKQNIVICT